MPAITALGRLRQENGEFEAWLGHNTVSKSKTRLEVWFKW
jgi:hypothetical protein